MKSWKFGIFCLSATLVVGCAPSPEAERNIASVTPAQDGIIGGEEVKLTDSIAKSIVGLQIKVKEMVLVGGKVVEQVGIATCTGTLITSNVVLTAAHCVQDATAISIFFGTSLVGAAADRKLVRSAVRIVYHKDFNLRSDKDANDLALVQFEGAPPAGFSPATLLNKADTLKVGTEIVLAGFGVTTMDEDIESGHPVLRKVQMKIDDPKFSSTEVLFNQKDGKGSCHGDSGGPAILQSGGKNLVFGVTSRGYDSDQGMEAQQGAVKCERYVIYTSIVPYLSWIKTQALPALKSMTNGSVKPI